MAAEGLKRNLPLLYAARLCENLVFFVPVIVIFFQRQGLIPPLRTFRPCRLLLLVTDVRTEAGMHVSQLCHEIRGRFQGPVFARQFQHA